MFTDVELEAIQTAAADGEDVQTERLVGEIRRLRLMLKPLQIANDLAAKLMGENKVLREGAGLVGSKAPALAVRVQELEKNVSELEEAHRKEFERCRVLENARTSALRAIEASARLKDVAAALRAIGDRPRECKSC